ncbi:MAG: squalene--hopene cyclase, partial [Syntrophobacteraceae bacterium]|nr:squalene--hopene cyclase [Syntrophobacteraceae bacterium]
MINKGGSVVGFLDVAYDLEDSRLLRSDSENPLKLKKLAFIKDQKVHARRAPQAPEPVQTASVESSWNRQIEKAIRSCREHYLASQHPDGYWWSELESNVTITSEYVMFRYLLGINDPEKNRVVVRYLLNRQSSNGSWELYFDDGGDLSTTVEAYFALKLAGEDPESEPMVRARDFILRHGGVDACRVFTKIWLALFSQYDWDKVPSMPVELVLLPPSFY